MAAPHIAVHRQAGLALLHGGSCAAHQEAHQPAIIAAIEQASGSRS